MSARVRDRFPNRHTEECTGCGARRGEVHDPDCRGHLGTGIRSIRGARRDLRRRFGQDRLPPIVRRPGARFYVTARHGPGATAYLLGPYVSHMTALAAVTRGARLLGERWAREASWLAVGTASRPDTVPTAFGR